MAINLRIVLSHFLICFVLLAAQSVKAAPSQYYEDALSAYEENKYNEAYIFLKNALQEDSAHLPSKLLMGRILLLDGHLLDAIDEFEESLQLGVDKNLVLPSLSRAYLLSAQYQKALDLASEGNLTSSTKLDVLLLAGQAHVRMGKSNLALQSYRSGVKKYPNSPRMLNALASMLIQNQELDQAEELLNRSNNLQQNNALTLHELGKLSKAKGNFDLAMQYYLQANKIFEDAPNIMRSMALLHAEKGEYAAASELVSKIEEQTPNDIQIRLLKARILALTQNQGAADKILLELSQQLSLLNEEQRNERIELSLITGVVAYINSNFSLASTELSRYSSERSPSAEVIGMLADSLLKVGYDKDALQVLEKHHGVVLSNLDVATLTCELYIAIRKPFKCELMIPKIEKRYENAIQVELIKARLLVDKNKPEEALKLLNEKLAGVEEASVLQLKTMLLASIGNIDQAFDTAEVALRLQPDNTDFKGLFADIAIRNNRTELAKQLVDEIIDVDPTNTAATIAMARIAFAEGDRQTAINSLENLVADDKRNTSALVLLGQIYTLERQFERAIDHLLVAKSFDTGNPEPRELLVSIYRQQRDFDNALSEINNLLNLNRLDATYIQQKADILLLLGRKEEASSQLSILFGLWQEDAGNLVRLSQMQVSAEDYANAERSLTAAIDKIPNNPLPKLEYVKFLTERKRIKEAEKQLSKFSRQFKENSNTAILRGDLAIAKANSSKAHQYYLQALDDDPNFRLPLIKLYQLALDDVGVDDLTNYLESQNEKDSFKKHLLADLYFINEKLSKAESIYVKLLADENIPRKEFIFNNLANIYTGQNLSKATSMAKSAFEINAENPAIIDTWGWIQVLNGELNQGLDTLRQSYTLDSSNPSVHFHLAYTLNQLGRNKEALNELTRHNSLQQEFKEKAQALELFNKLSKSMNN